MRQSPGISLESFGEGKEKMTEGSGYGMLVVGIARHDRRPMFFSLFEKCHDEKD